MSQDKISEIMDGMYCILNWVCGIILYYLEIMQIIQTHYLENSFLIQKACLTFDRKQGFFIFWRICSKNRLFLKTNLWCFQLFFAK